MSIDYRRTNGSNDTGARLNRWIIARKVHDERFILVFGPNATKPAARLISQQIHRDKLDDGLAVWWVDKCDAWLPPMEMEILF